MRRAALIGVLLVAAAVAWAAEGPRKNKSSEFGRSCATDLACPIERNRRCSFAYIEGFVIEGKSQMWCRGDAKTRSYSFADPEPVEVVLERAQREYDLALAERLLEGLDSDVAATVRAQAALLVAELARLEFEQTAEDNREVRRELGRRIDAAARKGLDALDRIPRGSRHFRMEADLLGTMIRSSFRAKKYLDRMRAATARALELDHDNAQAWVAAAKPLVFADEEHGRDLDEAVRLLDRALALQAGLESALLLRAHALDLAGDAAAARADWEQALAANPSCEPARRRLEASP